MQVRVGLPRVTSAGARMFLQQLAQQRWETRKYVHGLISLHNSHLPDADRPP